MNMAALSKTARPSPPLPSPGVLDAIISVFGPQTVGVRLCPSDGYNDSAVSFSELTETYIYYINKTMDRDVEFINLS